MPESVRFDASQGPRIVHPGDGRYDDLGGCGARLMISGEESGGGFALVEHPIPARHLAAPVHRHHDEDEYSYILEGTLGALLGDDIVFASVGDLVFKPREQWHTFWNAGDTPCRILEVISPGGFERFFTEVTSSTEPAAALSARYRNDLDLERTQRLCHDRGLVFPPPPGRA
jgi:mannose-6-phosphate isomerase-like protein (cupin superfamily)